MTLLEKLEQIKKEVQSTYPETEVFFHNNPENKSLYIEDDLEEGRTEFVASLLYDVCGYECLVVVSPIWGKMEKYTVFVEGDPEGVEIQTTYSCHKAAVFGLYAKKCIGIKEVGEVLELSLNKQGRKNLFTLMESKNYSAVMKACSFILNNYSGNNLSDLFEEEDFYYKYDVLPEMAFFGQKFTGMNGLLEFRHSPYLLETGVEKDFQEFCRHRRQMKFKKMTFPLYNGDVKALSKAHQTDIEAYNFYTELKRKLNDTFWTPYSLQSVVETEGFVLSTPSSVEEVKEIGRRQSHCIGGYAECHLNNALIFSAKVTEEGARKYGVPSGSTWEIMFSDEVERNEGGGVEFWASSHHMRGKYNQEIPGELLADMWAEIHRNPLAVWWGEFKLASEDILDMEPKKLPKESEGEQFDISLYEEEIKSWERRGYVCDLTPIPVEE